ncbi:MAG: FxsA family protein [Candidatus Palauibacterales bacterium]|nr:FxsA family protein [Candidatus Palauibacterales bacterium]MDP2528551.1 FxsA family protein [Candidatus Palauibacterales bacterium]MDP2584781.1 FxsA family protein [Candidatus Palauibacterales bacterium]
MLGRLFLLFTLVPLAELWLLLRIGAWVGLLPTLALVVGTGVAGAWLARREGTRCWATVQTELRAGRVPGEEILHAFLVLAAGLLLITPGILTDLTGLALLLRPVRRLAVRSLRRRLEAGVRSGNVRIFGAGSGGFGAGRPPEPGSGRPERDPARGGSDPGAEGNRTGGGRVIEM